MDKAFVTPLLLLVLVASCDSPRVQPPQAAEQPKALTEKGNSLSYVSKRGYGGDMVEDLYQELAAKDPVLQELEQQVAALGRATIDSNATFAEYDKKSRAYYNSAEGHLFQIKDSVLRNQIRAIVAKSSENYGNLITRHSALLAKSQEQAVRLSDLHNVLKVVRTLPLIEEYQRTNLPSLKPLEGLIQQQNRAIRLADSLQRAR